MAVIVSQRQNEVKEPKRKGLDIRSHSKRRIDKDLNEQLKDDDGSSCSPIYLDKPTKNHTLMPSIVRANRKHPGAGAGLIVDYVGVVPKLQQALAIDGKATGER